MLPRGCGAGTAPPARPPRRMAFLYVPIGATWPTGRRRRRAPTSSCPRRWQPMAAHRKDTARPQRPGLRQGAAQRRRRRRPRARRRRLPDRLPAAQDRRGELPGRRLRRPGRRPPAGRPDAPAVAGNGHRALPRHRQLRQRLLLRLRAHHCLAQRHVAAADRGESQAGVRAAVLGPAQRSRPSPSATSCGPACSTRCWRTRAAWKTQLGGADKQKLDQYLSCVRELELRIARAEKLPPVQPPAGTARPQVVPADYQEHVRLMCDLLVLAFQTDVTRIATFMFAREGSEHAVPDARHHRRPPRMHAPPRQPKNDRQGLQDQHASTSSSSPTSLGKLKAIKEGDGTLLDNCMIAYGSGIEDGSMHTHDDLPIAAGRQGRRHDQDGPPRPLSARDAGEQPVAGDAGPHGRADRETRRQHGSAGRVVVTKPLSAPTRPQGFECCRRPGRVGGLIRCKFHGGEIPGCA